MTKKTLKQSNTQKLLENIVMNAMIVAVVCFAQETSVGI